MGLFKNMMAEVTKAADDSRLALIEGWRASDLSEALFSMPPQSIVDLMTSRGLSLTVPPFMVGDEAKKFKKVVSDTFSTTKSLDAVLARLPHQASPWLCRNWARLTDQQTDISKWTAKKKLLVGVSSSADRYEVWMYPQNIEVKLKSGADGTKYKIVPIWFDSVNNQVLIGAMSGIYELISLLRAKGMRQFSTELLHSVIKGETLITPEGWKPLVPQNITNPQIRSNLRALDQGIFYPAACFLANSNLVADDEKGAVSSSLVKIGSAVIHPDWKVLALAPKLLESDEEVIDPTQLVVYGQSEGQPKIVRIFDSELIALLTEVPRAQMRGAAVFTGIDAKSIVLADSYVDVVVAETAKSSKGQASPSSLAQYPRKGVTESALTLVVDFTKPDQRHLPTLSHEGDIPSELGNGDLMKTTIKWVRLDGTYTGTAVIEYDDVLKWWISAPEQIGQQTDPKEYDVLSASRLLPPELRTKVGYFKSASWAALDTAFIEDGQTQLVGPRSVDEATISSLYHRWVSRLQPWRVKRGKVPDLLRYTMASLLFNNSAISTGELVEHAKQAERPDIEKRTQGLRGFDDRATHLISITLK